MAMFMYVYRIFISLLLILVHCEVTVEQATHGPLRSICTVTKHNTSRSEIPPLAREDEDVITELLRCKSTVLRPSCLITGSNSKVTCDCYVENHTRCRVVEMDFSNRRIEGWIPNNIGNLKYLTTLNLDGNKLRGPIPDSFENLTRLTHISLCKNMFDGIIPPNLKSLESLEILQLQNNEFVGALPSSFYSLVNLKTFDVRGNNLSGKIPDFTEGWKNLLIMNLMGNNFSAPLPHKFTELKNLAQLYISDLVEEHSSPLVGEHSFPDLSKMKSLKTLTLRNCSLNTGIPDWIWTIPHLEYLDLSFNNLSGVIPDTVQESLKFIFLRKNKFTGRIPAWADHHPYVDLSENHFNLSLKNTKNHNFNQFACCLNETEEVAKRDQVDLHCRNGAQLNDHLYINCGGVSASVYGNVYEADVQEEGGSTFFMSNNLNWGYSSMGTSLWAKRDRYTLNDVCEVHTGEAELYGTARLSSISLKYYGFCLVPGTYKVILHFADISKRKHRLSHGKTRRVFDIVIQGIKVEPSFNIEAEGEGKAVNEPITKEYSAEVHNNLLEIHLYWSGKGSILYPSDNYGPLISAITVTLDQSHLSLGVLVGISGSALLFLTLFIVFSWMYQEKLRREDQEIEFYPGGLYNYRKIKAATNNFDDKNRLGEGGFGTVYKGTLSNGAAIAVKKLSTTKEGMNEFMEKSRRITGMKHPNLVTLMGCCAGKNKLLLIYEYIGTKSLQDALFGPEELRPTLDWPTRYRICLGVAEGLSFLHEGSKHKIIHGNIKPENILLDDDLNPKIYDFGFAKIYQKQKSEGTMSYLAPEVKDRALEANADVYSFGVVMLIIFSRRRISTPGAGGGDREYLVDQAQIMNRKGHLLNLLEDIQNCNWVEADIVLRLAIQCIDTPPFRPTMSEVVEVLRKERSIETILNKSKGDCSAEE
ncbi:probable LRR receptor-like serine/threonine-protein kinase At1g53440 isoform X5 [Solanum pennellii]|uniref:non-specific serine/threonine protein kinase n=1 Tax=Solanum pennellii TaxID=28526 RepID=A0ABM1V6G9_SOLPN|nr:probable LRR receptor-like serine/threonine-protein kinase At1g53440 isoform X5 [Solanum pennellii]